MCRHTYIYATYIHTHIHTCMCVCACVHACMYVCMYVGMYVSMYVYMYVCMYVCIHVAFFWNVTFGKCKLEVISPLYEDTVRLRDLREMRLNYACRNPTFFRSGSG